MVEAGAGRGPALPHHRPPQRCHIHIVSPAKEAAKKVFYLWPKPLPPPLLVAGQLKKTFFAQTRLFDLFKTFDQIESSHKSEFFF